MKDAAQRPPDPLKGGLSVVEGVIGPGKEGSNMAKRYYIAYGSNLNTMQMRMRCPTAKIIGTGRIWDYRLLFKGSKTGSYLTIEPAEGYSVPVAVWEVTPIDEVSLDRYEGFPRFYYKTEMTVKVTGIRSGAKSRRTGFVYIMDESRNAGTPRRYYMDVCRQGYKTFGFDTETLEEALRYSKERASNEE